MLQELRTHVPRDWWRSSIIEIIMKILTKWISLSLREYTFDRNQKEIEALSSIRFVLHILTVKHIYEGSAILQKLGILGIFCQGACASITAMTLPPPLKEKNHQNKCDLGDLFKESIEKKALGIKLLNIRWISNGYWSILSVLTR